MGFTWKRCAYLYQIGLFTLCADDRVDRIPVNVSNLSACAMYWWSCWRVCQCRCVQRKIKNVRENFFWWTFQYKSERLDNNPAYLYIDACASNAGNGTFNPESLRNSFPTIFNRRKHRLSILQTFYNFFTFLFFKE